jgi:protein TonB
MAYADRNTSGSKVVSIVIVSIIVALFAWGFVNGLTFKYIKKVTEKLNTFDVVEPPPPPPDKPPPPPPEQPQLQTPPVVSPPPIVKVQSPPPPIQTVVTPPPAAPITVRAAAPAPVPVPAPPRVSQAAGLRGDPSQYFGPDAYPSDAQQAEASGRVVAKLTVGTNGRVTDCVVTTSSGNGSLDRATCSISKRSVKFTPAKDDAGNPIVSTYTLPVRWVLPQ